MSLSDNLGQWYKKWMRKPVSGRCLIELKEMNKEAIKELKEEFKINITVISKRKFLDAIDEIFGEKLI